MFCCPENVTRGQFTNVRYCVLVFQRFSSVSRLGMRSQAEQVTPCSARNTGGQGWRFKRLHIPEPLDLFLLHLLSSLSVKPLAKYLLPHTLPPTRGRMTRRWKRKVATMKNAAKVM